MLACESLSSLSPWIRQWEGKVLDQNQPKSKFWTSQFVSLSCLILPFAHGNRISYNDFWTDRLVWKNIFPPGCPAGRTLLKRLIGWVKRESYTSWWSLSWSLYWQKNTHSGLVCQLEIGSFLFSFKWSLKKYQHMFPKCCISVGDRSFMRRALRMNVSITGKHFNTLFTWKVIRGSLFLQVHVFACCVLLLPYMHGSSLDGGTGL